MASTIAAIWALCGIASCVILIYQDRNYIRGMSFDDCILFILMTFCLCVLGPIGLVVFLLASLMRYASNHLL